jgi:hypothetical protein
VSEETRRLAAGRCIRAIIGLISVTWAIRMMLHAGASGRALITDARGAAMCAEQGQDAAILRMDRIRAFPGGAAEHGR